MDALVAIVAVVIVVIIGLYYLGHRKALAARALKDSRSQARRWVERLGGQVYSLEPKDDPAARQALADAAERFTAAGAQVERAASPQQYRLAELTAHEGLYYVRAARVSLGLDPGPPATPSPRPPSNGGSGMTASSPGSRTSQRQPWSPTATPAPPGWSSTKN
jgi:hypothetical protein